jgi:hypothetical protein
VEEYLAATSFNTMDGIFPPALPIVDDAPMPSYHRLADEIHAGPLLLSSKAAGARFTARLSRSNMEWNLP